MKISRKQFILFCCALLLQLGLLASSVHAEQHPFHAQSDLCASFINFSQHDMSVDVAPVNIDFHIFSVTTVIEKAETVSTAAVFVYSSRAPPVS